MIKNSFSKGPESWCAYDYHASMVADGQNIFILATWAKGGGVNGGNCIWVDHRRWSADTPEKPLSILPLLHYRSWVDADPAGALSLTQLPAGAWSYGFSFVGFSSEVTGRLSLAEFAIRGR